MDDIQEGEIVEQPSLTPLPKASGQAMTMSFLGAMKEIVENNNKVARLSWQNPDYCLLRNGWLTIFTKSDFHSWNINDGDIEGQDWVVVKEINETN